MARTTEQYADASTGFALECDQITKIYGGIRALVDVDLVVPRGAVEALVGQNGAGKSTLIGILSGRTAPTRGTVRILGKQPVPGEPRSFRDAGLVTIYQELTLVPGLAAEENVFLGMLPSATGVVRRGVMRERYTEFCQRIGVAIPPRVPAGQLSVADCQVLEIMRALVADAKVILLDEPTAALAASERDALLALVGELRSQGVTVIYVSHDLREVLDIADHVTVLRDGTVSGSGPVEEWNEARLVKAMLGDKAERLAARMLEHRSDGRVQPHRSGLSAPPAGEGDGPPAVLEARGISLDGAISDVDLTVRRGEIVGLGGLVGSGRSTVMRCLAGMEPRSRGSLTIDGRPVPWPRSVRRALRRGLAMIPEDRKRSGLVLGMSAMDNVALPDMGGAARWGWLSAGRLSGQISAFAADFGFDPSRLGDAASNLSGGNQQKLMLLRWRYKTPVVLLADEPTRGIDVGAKEEVLDSLRRFAHAGIGVVVASSELEEISMLADRIVILSEGRAVAELMRKDGRISVDEIVSAIYESAQRSAVAAR